MGSHEGSIYFEKDVVGSRYFDFNADTSIWCYPTFGEPQEMLASGTGNIEKRLPFGIGSDSVRSSWFADLYIDHLRRNLRVAQKITKSDMRP